jgi:hypothetical protein
MSLKMKYLLILPLALAGGLLLAGQVWAEELAPGPIVKEISRIPEPISNCWMTGHIGGELNPGDLELGKWKYTLTMSWNSDSRHDLSHWNLFLDESHYHCAPEEILSAVHWADPAAYSTGDPDGCTVYYDVVLTQNGDPSIDLEGIILKFEPRENDCEPGPTGEATFVFYSDDPPAPILMPNGFLSDKAGQIICYGEITGVFPGLECDPTVVLPSSWGALKGSYR